MKTPWPFRPMANGWLPAPITLLAAVLLTLVVVLAIKGFS